MAKENFKNLLKRNRFVYSLNAAVKSAEMRFRSERLSRKYAALCADIKYEATAVPSLIQARLKSRGIFATRNDRLRIVWVGTNWDQDNSGFLQALNRFGEVFNFCNSRGDYGLEYGADAHDSVVALRNGKQLLRQVEEIESSHGKIDLLIGQMLENYVPVEYLKQIQYRGIATANIAMDDRLPELWERRAGRLQGAVGLVDGIDLTLTTSPECCVRYAYHGGVALFWPLASDPELFKPAVEKSIDVSFVGNNYGSRGAIVRSLRSAGIRVEAYGRGWPNGSVTAGEAAAIFGSSKIILGIGTIGYCDQLFTLKLRDFDATMAGAVYITHRNPDLLQLFSEGTEIASYASSSEAIEKIIYYLAHPEIASRVGRAAALKARKLHTWDVRIASALATMGFSSAAALSGESDMNMKTEESSC